MSQLPPTTITAPTPSHLGTNTWFDIFLAPQLPTVNKVPTLNDTGLRHLARRLVPILHKALSANLLPLTTVVSPNGTYSSPLPAALISTLEDRQTWSDFAAAVVVVPVNRFVEDLNRELYSLILVEEEGGEVEIGIGWRRFLRVGLLRGGGG
ncbi:hypothetical protein HDV00_008048 [Rhizophlyctis rosea]|nr:hypothetical protein HDV00_008048 [Rhizophlyctis rosea]